MARQIIIILIKYHLSTYDRIEFIPIYDDLRKKPIARIQLVLSLYRWWLFDITRNKALQSTVIVPSDRIGPFITYTFNQQSHHNLFQSEVLKHVCKVSG